MEVLNGEQPLALGGGRHRALLAVLLLHANEVVSFDRLVDDLWGEQPPPSAHQMVKGYVSDLRRDLATADGRSCIVTRVPGYVAEIEPSQLDAACFEALLSQGSDALASGRHREAAERLREALALWRGRALVEFSYEPFAQNTISRLEDLRLVALELRIAADLELGRAAELVGELEALVREQRYRERLRELLMLALYRSGRQAEALEVYQATRATWVEELGIEPGKGMQRLEQMILRHDPSLDPAPEVPPEPAEAVAVSEPPEPARPVEERRKTVTVLFCDVADSTELGERLDPELLRGVLVRYFELVAGVLERHGASVEKFVGDAVMAVFGVPDVHEDDAMRAVRAAFELRDELAGLNEQLEREVGFALEVRVGINTGEVVAGDHSAGQMIVTGDAVNVAARLQQVGQPGEILLGETTWRLVADAVEVEATSPLTLKGKGQAVPAFRLLGLIEGAPAYARRFEVPLVGRTHELTQLRDAFARCVRESSAALFTVLGQAGIGKSRLFAEARPDLESQALVLTAACLPYGEGITFWPLRAMLVQALGEPLERGFADLLASQPDKAWVAAAAARFFGFDDQSGGGSLEESFLAVRRLLEQLAYDRPLVLVFEDIHWAEPALLDLIEDIVELARAAPIFVLCLARPDLLEQRPTWAGGKLNATTLLLERLSPEEAAQLAEWLLPEERLAEGVRAHALELAEGNPLFLEQLCAHAIEQGRQNAEHTMPPTILALLAARLDRLGPAERTLIEHAAIVGTEFEVAALAELTPSALQPSIGAHLNALMRKEFIRPARASRGGGEVHRFRHVLIRDAAYRSIVKGQRAELHERFADWLGANRGEDEFCDELVGHHLEQAYRCAIELRVPDDATAALARRASGRLESAWRRALMRSDAPAAIGLLERSASLLPDTEPRRLRLMADLAATLTENGELTQAETVLQSAALTGSPARDPWADARLRVEEQLLEFFRSDTSAAGKAMELATRVIPLLEQAGDQRGLARACRLKAVSEWVEARTDAAAAAWEQAARHARAAGDEHERAKLLGWVASALWFGPMPVDEAIRRCEEIRADVSGQLISEAELLRPLGALHGFAGRFDVARSFFAKSASIFDELGLSLNSVTSHHVAVVEMLAGNYALAEEHMRAAYDALDAMGERSFRSTTAAFLAQAAFAQGRFAEAEWAANVSEELAQADDLLTQILWRGVRAKLLAGRGLFEEAEALAREAVAIAARTDLINFHADALTDLAVVLEAADHRAETSAILAEALRRYEAKGNVIGAARARTGLDALSHA
ncbi:MAG TPA: BTAD domain-containing putative transcriptional regulator [Gaiellaceae bacterium]|nr:BTAD domain-containing putative transcriptional regulator [Gaiellaceae bacterium]